MTVSDHPRYQDAAISVDRVVDGEWVVVTASGELDVATVSELRDVLDPAGLPEGRKRVALDLSGLTFCDSSGIGLFVGAYKRLKAEGGRLVLLHVPDFLVKRLKVTGVDRALPITSDLGTV